MENKGIKIKSIKTTVIGWLFVVVWLAVFAIAAAFAVSYEKKKGITVYVVSDTHVVANSSFDEEGYAASLNAKKMNCVSEAVFCSFVDELVKGGCEYLLISGDLTESGDRESAEVVAEQLKKAESFGIRVLVINGNHDVGKNKMSQEEFKSVFGEFGYNRAADTYDGTLSYVAELDKKHVVIAIDNVEYTRSDGTVKAAMDEGHRFWIYDKLDDCKKAGLTPIIIAHKPLMTHMPEISEPFADSDIVWSNRAILDYYAKNGGEYLFVGHEHFNDIKTRTVKDGEDNRTVYEVMNSCLTMSTPYYRRVRFGENDTELTRVELAAINTDYLGEYVTDEQKQAIEGDYSKYARESLYLYMDKLYENTLVSGANALNGKALLWELYEVINECCLQKCLRTPYYKADERSDGKSLERILEEFGLDMPDVEYKNFTDFANDALFEIIAGERNFDDEHFTELFVYTVYELFYFMDEAREEINGVLAKYGIENGIDIDTERLFAKGELECYGSNLIPVVADIAGEYVKSLPSMVAAIIDGTLVGLKTDMSALKNELVSGLVGGLTDNIVVGYEQYIHDAYIDLDGLLKEGVLGSYMSDFVGENPYNGERVVIKK